MALIDLSLGQQIMLQDSVVLESLPLELLEVIRFGNNSNFLDGIATASLIPALTLRNFVRFECVFADICARWIYKTGDESRLVLEAFARILRFAPHLSVYLEKYLQQSPGPTQSHGQSRQDITVNFLSRDSEEDILKLSELHLQRLLLAAFRLLVFDERIFTSVISLSKVQTLLQHLSRPVRYLAVNILCHLLSASDAKLEEMIDAYVGGDTSVMGDFDGHSVDYGFLGLYEERVRNDLERMREDMKNSTLTPKPFSLQRTSPLVACFEEILLPRPNGEPKTSSSLVRTVTTSKNMRNFAETLLSDSPILVHGLSGSGKTSLVHDFARELGKDDQMVTLHLNEQTDAKMLIGMYVTDATPGSFTWRPGVLTTAVCEGRWVFIEDLDRAPNEVVSVILPLIEQKTIFVPSRARTYKAAPGFRLIASLRTSLNMSGHEITPSANMLGARLWRKVHVLVPSQGEFIEMIQGIHPILHKFLPDILVVYERLYTLSQRVSYSSKGRASVGRHINPRDLFKWCRRLDATLRAAGSKTGEEPIDDTTKDEMFMEAVDCFASYLQLSDYKKSITYCIAEEMHISAQRAQHYLDAHSPRYEESETVLQVGRVKLSKRKRSNQISKPLPQSMPFATTTHAKRLLEQIGVALKMSEPVLLVGETGIGKTTLIQQLADKLGHKLLAINLSQQSEVGDLLGGFKPVNIRNLAIPLKEEFDDLFARTGISAIRNQKFLEQLGKCIAKNQWSRASKLWHEAPRMFERILSELSSSDVTRQRIASEQPNKRRKTDSRLQILLDLKPCWERFSRNLAGFDFQLSTGSKDFAFTFVEGKIIRAVRNGDWVLLDEINLASPDTLESIADLLHNGPDGSPSILLSETGEIQRVRAHPDFRIFGAMNPATDVGKRDLPIGLRSRFTEIYVESPDRDLDDLLTIVRIYLKGTSSNDERASHDVARLYLNTKRMADEKRLVDGANQVPHFSLRTLTRVLGYATEIAPSYGLRRALYEGYAMGFLTLLNGESERMLIPLVNHHLLESHSNPQSLLSQAPRHPEDGRQYVKFMNRNRDRQYWMLQGCESPYVNPVYIITPFVERNMLNLVRATSTRRFPVLVQGPTSSGKTSMIEYLANFSGNKFVRINNHEHTDLQEYLGSYVSGSDGQLRFQEGILVQALREGHWIVLDELNLAPSDVLEALNRLLDDNRELFIPETQEMVSPHENFMLFATQNPPGLYGGRKVLSRAFRNRFLELHFDDIPEDELEYILEKRSHNVAPSDCKRIVTVYKELSRLRQSNRLFETKESFATLRDLFRWASRDASNREQLAANGYMLLAERVRKMDERSAVQEVIEKVMKVKLDLNTLYSLSSCPEIQLYNNTANAHGIVWNYAMRRLYILVAHALRNNEPILLVGETGCGKTTVCQMIAEAFGKKLHVVNAHQNTETGDLIGAQRPVRNRGAVAKQLGEDLVTVLNSQIDQETSDSSVIDMLLESYKRLSNDEREAIPKDLQRRIALGELKAQSLFEWADGNLVHAMKEGQMFLLDEISLADDSVLERLNSVLEAGRTLLLAEKGVKDSFVQASSGFQFFATMNPGGDYGKRELSPALRNRFTEIWVPSLSDHEDILQIVEAKLCSNLKQFGKAMVQFAEWFTRSYHSSTAQSVSVRDVLAWTTFVNQSRLQDLSSVILHGAALIYIDTLGANPAALLAIDPETIVEVRRECVIQLSTFLGKDVMPSYDAPICIEDTEHELHFGSFSISKTATAGSISNFAFQAPTTKLNAMRVVRALELQKPILIEGNPGVGKTTLIAALARAIGNSLTRINLSEQTDLMDLFGSDVPVEGGEAGNFEWRDAPFLQAMQNGDWVLLDEMNLASQSVLEGLNACLDHRGTVYISELDQTFNRHANFRVFAAQNPHHQGGGRKGLPSSFVNRFTVVYADVFKNDDLTLICKHNFPAVSDENMFKIIKFVSVLEQDVVYQRRFGAQGGPWEFNLRDSLRWLQLIVSPDPLVGHSTPADFLDIVFRQRFRTSKDRQEVEKVFTQVFGIVKPFHHYFHNLSKDSYQVGRAHLPRQALIQKVPFPPLDIKTRLPELESIMMCIRQNLPCLLVGPSGSGKTTLLQHVAAAAGSELVIFALNSDIDTIDLVGGYEQVDPQRTSSMFLMELRNWIETRILSFLPNSVPYEAFEILFLSKSVHENSAQHFLKLYSCLLALQSKTESPELDNFVTCCKTLTTQSSGIKTARFEWVDGTLIKALEEGKWLVLDNANLCSSSVLDRLNSLLEPDGFLTVNEHCGPNGEAKVVKPHPGFRLFMTMDPRFGELSRAMRNRAVEIYIDHNTDLTATEENDRTASRPLKLPLQRYMRVFDTLRVPFSSDETGVQVGVALDHISRRDADMLGRFTLAVSDGLISSMKPEISRVLELYLRMIKARQYEKFQEDFQHGYNLLMDGVQLSQSFKDAQPIHPLQNSPLVPMLNQFSPAGQIIWLGAMFDFQLDICSAYNAINHQGESLASLKPSKMNRLQRSLYRDRLPSATKDSILGISMYLLEILEYLEKNLLQKFIIPRELKVHRRAINTVLQLWWETYRLASSPVCEDATFHGHIAICRDILSRELSKITILTDRKAEIQQDTLNYITAQKVIEFVQMKIVHYFQSAFILTTGLSMEVLWHSFRPKPVYTLEKLHYLIDMKELATRFDDLKWRASTSVTELSSITLSLVQSYGYILSSEADGLSLVQTLSSEIATLEAGLTTEETSPSPFFSAQFEALRQYKAFKNPGNIAAEILTLCGNSTASLMQFNSATSTSIHLQKVNYIWSSTAHLIPVEDSFSASLLHKMSQIVDVDLNMLGLLEKELPILGEHMARETTSLCRDQLVDLNMNLLRLVTEATRPYNDDLTSAIENFAQRIANSMNGVQYQNKSIAIDYADYPNMLAGIPRHFEEIFKEHLNPAFSDISNAIERSKDQMMQSSLAWIHVAIGCITLYVPDRSFDPNNKQSLERQQHRHTKAKLDKKLAALRDFEKTFTGQSNNLRCSLLEADISELGEPAQALKDVVRPEVSEIEQLQGEFNNLLNLLSQTRPVEIVRTHFEANSTSTMQNIELLQNNVAQIVHRLSERFHAYSDLTVPAVCMLQCLQVGLYMSKLVSANASSRAVSITEISATTPFLGGSLLQESLSIPDQAFDKLADIVVIASVEGLDSFNANQRKLFLDTVQSCYSNWIKRLEMDRNEANLKSGVYRFRGSAEDEGEDDQDEFNELFPDFDEKPNRINGNLSPAYSARDIAITLTKLHAKIVLEQSSSAESILFLLRSMSDRIGTLYDGQVPFSNGLMTPNLIPGVLLKLNDHMEALNSSSAASDSYNFYTDANLPEVRKLVHLVHQIQNRFRELQSVDEIGHMQPLEDVMTSCLHLLRFRHTEPLAKIITKVEIVHNHMHEWQFGGWASRSNSILELYDRLTSTIVSWRRLELATWARLFDMENKKCNDDANSWWFVAYEVVIAVPFSMSESESELRSYAQKLLQNLETYFTTAIQGQFKQRLQLLKQLQRHLEVIAMDAPLMSIIHDAVANFTTMYARYENSVSESIKVGRMTLEKIMQDVLLLASWKDTNIIALRDSARRSHHKLFKLVRKYRALLSQPMEQILKQGLPEENADSGHDPTFKPSVQLLILDDNALALCHSRVPYWSQKPKRLVKVSKTVGLMETAAKLPLNTLDVVQYLESFLSNIIDSTAEFQKATPSILTEDNKNTVKHLKSRKRKLFADTLRELRQMGIKHNLSTAALTKQESLSVVLSNAENLVLAGSWTCDGLEYYYHKAIDMMPRARAIVRQQSPDLTGAEVTRSIGVLEGLLQLLLKQRNGLSFAMVNYQQLDITIKMAQGLWAPGQYEITKYASRLNYISSLKWLPSILRVSVELIIIHGQLGKLDHAEVLKSLLSFVNIFDDLNHKWVTLPRLPPGIGSTTRERLERQVDDAVSQLRLGVHDISQRHPNLECIVKHILLWTLPTSEALPIICLDGGLSVLDQRISGICDSILVAMEHFSTSSKQMPLFTEDQAWLITADNCMMDSLKILRVPEIIAQINSSFELLYRLPLNDDHVGETVGAMFAVAFPILQQYHNILQQSIVRYASLSRITCKTTYILGKVFIQIASRGFCTPSEKSDEEYGKKDKLEGGTGLGDGEGEEDISKDVEDDEDLSELAQEPSKGEQEDISNEKDAVDMADEDMEGKVGDKEKNGDDGEGNDSDETDEDEIDEESGNVDDLDPTAVDEKMWNGEGEKAEKEQEGDQSKGTSSKDEQAAAHDNDQEPLKGEDESDDEKEDGEGVGAEESEEVKQDQIEHHDRNAQEEQALELPEKMDLDGNDQVESSLATDDGMDDLSDGNEDVEGEDEQEIEGNQEIDESGNAEMQDSEDVISDLGTVDPNEDESEQGRDTKEADKQTTNEAELEENGSDVEERGLLRDSLDDSTADDDNVFSSNAQGTGEWQEQDHTDGSDASASAAQPEDTRKEGKSSEQRQAAHEGRTSRQANGNMPKDQSEDRQASAEAKPFKQLGDALKEWYRQQSKILEIPDKAEKSQDPQLDNDMSNAEFQHLQDENAQSDTQALGTATEVEAHPLDESMAIDMETEEMPQSFEQVEAEAKSDEHSDVDVATPTEYEKTNFNDNNDGREGAIIRQATATHKDRPDVEGAQEHADIEDHIEEVDLQLSSTHIAHQDIVTWRPASDARQLWTHYESLTRDLSLSLTEQLRLILAPTQATKMRGDFRTGKRLNIKRIIPYIASQYKRDKIWMRRSVPSKRSYQIMLAVDDSKSMEESGSGSLAFETLVMVSKSLGMLEVGEICIVGFGQDVRVAHDFDTPFGNDAGPKVLQNFGFNQGRTDVTKLVTESIELFRKARAKAASSPADLWQLELIISDGVCNSSEHEPIRRLLRQAIEERIMMVFVIMDDVKNKRSGESVMDLKEAKFVKDEVTGVANVKVERYLDTFPFQYYLIVSDVKELPGVLATLLRQWFAEVSDSGR